MKCQKCGTEFEGNFCPNCGAGVQQENNQQHSEYVSETIPQQQNQPSQQQIGSKPPISTALVIVLLIIFFPIGLYFMWARTNWNKVVKIIITIFIALCFIGAMTNPGSSKTNDNSNTQPTTAISETTSAISETTTAEVTTEEPTTVEPTKDPKAVKSDFISSCKEYKYKDIARDPSKYEGKLAKFKGQVVQVQESGDFVVLRVNVTATANQFADGGYLWDDTVYVEYTRKAADESRILEDDIVTMYGTINGIKTYETVLGSDLSLPYLLAEYIEIN